MNILTSSLARWLCATLFVGATLLNSTTAQAQNYWIGTTDTIYTKPNNWSLRRVPNSTDEVLIQPTGSPVSVPTETPAVVFVLNQPALSAALGIGQANNVTIYSGARLRLGPQSELDLFGNLVNNGLFVGTGALVTKTPVSGSSIHVITGAGNAITINDLVIDTSTPVILGIPVSLRRLLSLVGNLTTTSVGTLTLLSNSAVTAFTVPAAVSNQGGIVIGSVTVQRAIDNTLNPGLGYRHYSSPVSNTTIADFATPSTPGNPGFTPDVSAGSIYNSSPTPPTTNPFPTVYGYDQSLVNRNNSSPNFDKGFFVPSSLNSPLIPGRGYAVNLNGSQLVDFVGSLNNGPVQVAVARNAAGTINADVAGWQFLGNPYPAPLDWSRVSQAQRDTAGFDGSIYVFRSTAQFAGMYRAYINNVGGNPVIPIGQGFFARVAAPTTSPRTFTFRNAQRLITSDGTTFQRTTADVRPQLELTLSESGNTTTKDYLNVYFESGSTAGVDAQYDAVKLPNSNGLNLSSLAASGEALTIDGRPTPVGQLTVPLQVFAPASGSYTLNASKLLNMAGLRPYLRDIQLGALIDLTQQPSYTFALNAFNFNARFELVFSAQPLAAVAPAALAQQVALYPSPAQGAAFVELPANLGSQAVTATLTDALGRAVRTTTLPAQGATAHQLSLVGLSSGIYLLRLDTSAGVITKRLAVK